MLASNWRSLVNGSSLFCCCHMPLKSHYGVQWCARPPFVPVVAQMSSERLVVELVLVGMCP